MRRDRLTAAECDRPNTSGKREKRSDGGGLSLQVTPTGARSWQWFYRFEGLARTLPLGAFPEVSIEDARARVAEAREQIRRGADPGARTQRAAKVQAARDRARRFDAVAQTWFREVFTPKTDSRYAARTWARVEAYLIPPLGDKDVAEVTAADVDRAVRAIIAMGEGQADSRIETARRVANYARAIFRYAAVAHGVTFNPAADVAALLPPSPPKRGQPALAPEEVAEFMVALRRPHRDDELTRLALELTMHTVLRSAELRGGRWGEVDEKAATWTVPPKRMKAGREHVVPLSRQALALVKRLREITGGGVMMFPGRRPGHEISPNTILFAIYGLERRGKAQGYRGRASGHGWRSTMASWAHESGRWPFEVVEAALAHEGARGNTVARAYNRQTYVRQRAELMQAWSEWLDAQQAAGLARDADLESLLAP